MSAPPGVIALTSTTQGIDFPGIEDLKVIARTVLWNCGVDYGPNKVNRLCVRFAQKVRGNGFDFFEFIANQVEMTVEQRRRALSDPDVQKVIAYADPTGETAVRNVMSR